MNLEKPEPGLSACTVGSLILVNDCQCIQTYASLFKLHRIAVVGFSDVVGGFQHLSWI